MNKQDPATQKALDIVRICEATRWSVNPELIYQNMVDVLVETFNSDNAYIHLITESFDGVVRYGAHSLSGVDRSLAHPTRPSKEGRLELILKSKQIIFMDYENPDPDDRIPEDTIALGYKCGICVPVVAIDEAFGFYTISYKSKKTFSEEDLEFCCMIGRVLGIVVQRIQQQRRNLELYILNERKALSTEIHDNLSQLISLISVTIGSATSAIEDNQIEFAKKDIDRASVASQEALRVLREEILYLRTKFDQTKGLVSSVEDCLERFRQYWGVNIIFHVNDKSDPVMVGVQTEIQLTRVLHEAISNILRHASAKQIEISLEGTEEWLSFEIIDDGCGFDPEQVSEEHLGIRIMKERIDALNGTFTIQSKIGKGTKVKILLSRFALY